MGPAGQVQPGAGAALPDRACLRRGASNAAAATRLGISRPTVTKAHQLGMSQSAISRIWRAFGLKPHLVDIFKLSTDPQFIDKVRDVVGL
jgi:hypothetical protein